VLATAALDFFERYNKTPEKTRSVIGSYAAQLI